MARPATLAERDELDRASITLNGQRAVFSWFDPRLPSVIVIDGQPRGMTFQWSLTAALRIVRECNGEFRA